MDQESRRAPTRLAGALAGLLLLGSLGCSDAPVLADCLPKHGMMPICLFQSPEDMSVVGHWLVVSQMPTAKKPGSLIAFHPGTATYRSLYPPMGAGLGTLPSEPASAGGAGGGGGAGEGDDGGCRAGRPPSIAEFAPHGIHVAGTRLLAVNHGRREAIEEFVLSADGTGLTLQWTACTPLPDDASANDVVALADGGFAATKMVERPQWLGIAKLLLGMKTGALLRYSPATKAWETVPNTAGRAPNGVEVDADGRFYVAEWTGRRIVRVAADGSGREAIDLDFSPDNLAWSADGRLLVAGQRAGVLDVPGCAAIEEGTCALPSVVVAIDPTAFKVYPILDEDPAVVLGAASIAVELDGKLWIGSFAGNRLVRRDGVR
ncbi:MAG: hypothetical protein U0900_10650 [Myxococcota bacterium]